MLDQYTYVFAIGTFFALLDAYNNGASESTSTGFLLSINKIMYIKTNLYDPLPL